MNSNKINYHQWDLPAGVSFDSIIAIDTETQGLNLGRDRLCMVQISGGDGSAHLIHFPKAIYDSPNLMGILRDQNIEKIFHYARFDVAVLYKYFEVICRPIYCTKIASKLVRTYTQSHGLKDMCKELLNIELSKEQQSSDWATEELTDDQKAYAANDVLFLHDIKRELDKRLARENRLKLAEQCFSFVSTRAQLDLEGWGEEDIFHH